MSLDVYLISEEKVKRVSSGIFIRENGCIKEISVEEWNNRFPNREPIKFSNKDTETNEVFHGNITHNLGEMAKEAGIYECLWRPDEVGIFLAKELIDPLRDSLHELKLNHEKYEKFNPKNGWGDYNGLVKFIEKYLDACYNYPDTKIEVSR
jgi:hypothetical protein